MNTVVHHKLSVFQKTKILLRILYKKEIESVLVELAAPQMQDLRNFLEEEIIYLSSTIDPSPMTQNDIKSQYEPVDHYYTKQDCREPLDACTTETCYTLNPICFSRKMESHINILTDLLAEYIFKPRTNGQQKSQEIQ